METKINDEMLYSQVYLNGAANHVDVFKVISILSSISFLQKVFFKMS